MTGHEMNANDFTSQLKKSIVDENTLIYRELFNNTETAQDPYWRRALALYRSLDDGQKGVFIEVLQQVTIDTLSNILSLLMALHALLDKTRTSL